MFFKLIDMISSQFWIIARSYYKQSIGYFKINGIIDNNVVKINRGVKQGGVLSPQLFNFFVNELLVILNNSGMGIRSELQRMMDICVNYWNKWLMKYNIKKSVIMNVGHQIIKNEDIRIKINDNIFRLKDK